MTCLADLIGVEFEYGGRGPEAYDCWGLVMECSRRWSGLELPDYRSSSSPDRNAVVMAQEAERLWRRLDRPVPGSVIIMRVKGFGAHVGFVHTKTRFLHALENFGVLEGRLAQYHRQIIGAYEYVGKSV